MRGIETRAGSRPRVAVILPDAARPEPGTARLLEMLCADARFALAGVIEAPGAAAPMPASIRLALAIEALLVPSLAAPATPALDAARADLMVRDPQGSADLGPLDVIIDTCNAPVAPTLAALARHGLWRSSSADNRAGLAEAMTGTPATPVALRTLDRPQGQWRVIAAASYDWKFLAGRNRDFLRDKAAQLIEHALARLALGREADLSQAPDHAPPPLSARLLPGYAGRVTQELGRRLVNKARARFGGRPRRFCIRLCRGHGPLDFDIAAGIEFDAPPGCYWADPFVFEHEGAVYVFVEEYVYRTGTGHIVACRLDGDRLVPLGPALRTDGHLSYPFVFRHGAEIYMMPETGSAGRLEIWRATGFPLEWERHATALEGTACADSAILADEDGMWIFTNICRDGFEDFGSELHLFRADGPDLREVVAHPLNPVVVGSRQARGAGRILRHEGRLLRPAQDNSHGTYGFGLNIMEITALNGTEYAETRLRHLTPEGDPDLIGCHHLDVAGDLVVFDVRRR